MEKKIFFSLGFFSFDLDLFFSLDLGIPFMKCFQAGSVIRNIPTNSGDAGDTGSVLELGRSPGGGNGNPLQYS